MGVYGAKRRTGEAIGGVLPPPLSRAVRRYFVFVLAAYALMGLGVLAGYRMTLADPESYYSFVGAAEAQGRTPASSTAELRKVLYSGGEGPLSFFATYLFTHNSRVGMLCFALGFAAGVPVIFLLFTNGLTLGAMAALYQTRGLGAEFWAWVMPHGVTELSAICLCGAAGMAHRHGARLPRPRYAAAQPGPARAGGGAAGSGRGRHVPGRRADRGDLPPARARRRHPLVPSPPRRCIFWTWYFLAVGRDAP